eukprot:4481956-Prymnesium_polylepis.2
MEVGDEEMGGEGGGGAGGEPWEAWESPTGSWQVTYHIRQLAGGARRRDAPARDVGPHMVSLIRREPP